MLTSLPQAGGEDGGATPALFCVDSIPEETLAVKCFLPAAPVEVPIGPCRPVRPVPSRPDPLFPMLRRSPHEHPGTLSIRPAVLLRRPAPRSWRCTRICSRPCPLPFQMPALKYRRARSASTAGTCLPPPPCRCGRKKGWPGALPHGDLRPGPSGEPFPYHRCHRALSQPLDPSCSSVRKTGD